MPPTPLCTVSLAGTTRGLSEKPHTRRPGLTPGDPDSHPETRTHTERPGFTPTDPGPQLSRTLHAGMKQVRPGQHPQCDQRWAQPVCAVPGGRAPRPHMQSRAQQPQVGTTTTRDSSGESWAGARCCHRPPGGSYPCSVLRSHVVLGTEPKQAVSNQAAQACSKELLKQTQIRNK